MRRSKTITALTLLAAIAVVTGCGGNKPGAGGENGQSADASKKPVVNTSPATLKLYLSNSSLSDQDVITLIEEPVKKLYPHISVETVRNGKGTTIEELLATGQTPDIFYTNIADIGKYKRYGLLGDITPLLKTNGVDLSRFDPQMLAGASSEQGEVYGLPFFAHFNANYYNKAIFDKFGTPYPQDGMTWEDVIELAKKVSRVDSGVTYRGLDPDTIARLAMPLAITLVDPKTNKATVNSDGWRTVFTLAKEIWSIPNNKPDKLNSFQARNWFMQDQNIAMLPYNNLLNIGLEEATKNGLNWDLVQYPSYKGKPNLYAFVDAQIFSISQTSKYKEQAAQLLSVVTSNEVQLKSARTTARFSSLKDPAMKEALGADMPFLKGKNLKSIFKSTAPAAPAFSPYDSSDVRNISFKSFEEYMKGKDLNTALREAEEKINQWIETNKMK
ncbi:extracellular solute-binding protein [Paenibacillus hemerocallicola]|uniref:Extracellular solute-binding protein n=1 Tax=Paenibacillus hemerocallicola TaxID=1172614 RepID=A0A5C4T494_9BACL|nr:extracellular solute-binding protein [Paenibacillus hemerocallicola]TNJ63912.1 extracellular solute-binding protein [Paenibacillus hemerocallicola]